MKSPGLPTVAPTVRWEDDASFIYIIEDKQVIPRDKNINIMVYFLK